MPGEGRQARQQARLHRLEEEQRNPRDQHPVEEHARRLRRSQLVAGDDVQRHRPDVEDERLADAGDQQEPQRRCQLPVRRRRPGTFTNGLRGTAAAGGRRGERHSHRHRIGSRPRRRRPRPAPPPAPCGPRLPPRSTGRNGRTGAGRRGCRARAASPANAPSAGDQRREQQLGAVVEQPVEAQAATPRRAPPRPARTEPRRAPRRGAAPARCPLPRLARSAVARDTSCSNGWNSPKPPMLTSAQSTARRAVAALAERPARHRQVAVRGEPVEHQRPQHRRGAVGQQAVAGVRGAALTGAQIRCRSPSRQSSAGSLGCGYRIAATVPSPLSQSPLTCSRRGQRRHAQAVELVPPRCGRGCRR